MTEKISWKENSMPKSNREESISMLKEAEIKKVKGFHESFHQYSMTPLHNLKELGSHTGLAGIYIKDESYRFGLNAFKVLGASFAVANYMAQELNMDIADLDYESLISSQVKEKLGDMVFVTATDGNHGRGVAWTARQLGQDSLIFMPKGAREFRVKSIEGEGAEVRVEDLNYDDTVRLAARYAEEIRGVLVQDTAWPGYEDIPSWIMQGYTTMALEAIDQLNELGLERPSHIFLQAGVGSFAAAIQGVFASIYGEDAPIVGIVEASNADWAYKSALRGDGTALAVGGDLQTIMAGLSCGEANPIGWEILKNYSSNFISSPDYIAANGVRILANPLGDDPKVISGESGAVTLGLLVEIMKNNQYKELRESLKLDGNSRVLLFSTEGDTDPEIYREILWQGRYSE